MTSATGLGSATTLTAQLNQNSENHPASTTRLGGQFNNARNAAPKSQSNAKAPMAARAGQSGGKPARGQSKIDDSASEEIHVDHSESGGAVDGAVMQRETPLRLDRIKDEIKQTCLNKFKQAVAEKNGNVDNYFNQERNQFAARHRLPKIALVYDIASVLIKNKAELKEELNHIMADFCRLAAADTPKKSVFGVGRTKDHATLGAKLEELENNLVNLVKKAAENDDIIAVTAQFADAKIYPKIVEYIEQQLNMTLKEETSSKIMALFDRHASAVLDKVIHGIVDTDVTLAEKMQQVQNMVLVKPELLRDIVDLIIQNPDLSDDGPALPTNVQPDGDVPNNANSSEDGEKESTPVQGNTYVTNNFNIVNNNQKYSNDIFNLPHTQTSSNQNTYSSDVQSTPSNATDGRAGASDAAGKGSYVRIDEKQSDRLHQDTTVKHDFNPPEDSLMNGGQPSASESRLPGGADTAMAPVSSGSATSLPSTVAQAAASAITVKVIHHPAASVPTSAPIKPAAPGPVILTNGGLKLQQVPRILPTVNHWAPRNLDAIDLSAERAKLKPVNSRPLVHSLGAMDKEGRTAAPNPSANTTDKIKVAKGNQAVELAPAVAAVRSQPSSGIAELTASPLRHITKVSSLPSAPAGGKSGDKWRLTPFDATFKSSVGGLRQDTLISRHPMANPPVPASVPSQRGWEENESVVTAPPRAIHRADIVQRSSSALLPPAPGQGLISAPQPADPVAAATGDALVVNAASSSASTDRVILTNDGRGIGLVSRKTSAPIHFGRPMASGKDVSGSSKTGSPSAAGAAPGERSRSASHPATAGAPLSPAATSVANNRPGDTEGLGGKSDVAPAGQTKVHDRVNATYSVTLSNQGLRSHGRMAPSPPSGRLHFNGTQRAGQPFTPWTAGQLSDPRSRKVIESASKPQGGKVG